MAVYDFGIDEDQDIRRALSDAGFDVGPATRPLNDTAVTSAVQFGSARAIGTASSVGVTADAQLLIDSEETPVRLKDLAIGVALEYLGLRHGRMREFADRWREYADMKLSELKSAPANFGADVPDISDVPHFVDTIETGAVNEIGGVDWEDTDNVF